MNDAQLCEFLQVVKLVLKSLPSEKNECIVWSLHLHWYMNLGYWRRQKLLRKMSRGENGLLWPNSELPSLVTSKAGAPLTLVFSIITKSTRYVLIFTPRSSRTHQRLWKANNEKAGGEQLVQNICFGVRNAGFLAALSWRWCNTRTGIMLYVKWFIRALSTSNGWSSKHVQFSNLNNSQYLIVRLTEYIGTNKF